MTVDRPVDVQQDGVRSNGEGAARPVVRVIVRRDDQLLLPRVGPQRRRKAPLESRGSWPRRSSGPVCLPGRVGHAGLLSRQGKEVVAFYRERDDFNVSLLASNDSDGLAHLFGDDGRIVDAVLLEGLDPLWSAMGLRLELEEDRDVSEAMLDRCASTLGNGVAKRHVLRQGGPRRVYDAGRHERANN